VHCGGRHPGLLAQCQQTSLDSRHFELGNYLTFLVVWLEMSPAGVGYAVKRGEAISHEMGIGLSDEILSYLGASPYPSCNLLQGHLM